MSKDHLEGLVAGTKAAPPPPAEDFALPDAEDEEMELVVTEHAPEPEKPRFAHVVRRPPTNSR